MRLQNLVCNLMSIRTQVKEGKEAAVCLAARIAAAFHARTGRRSRAPPQASNPITVAGSAPKNRRISPRRSFFSRTGRSAASTP